MKTSIFVAIFISAVLCVTTVSAQDKVHVVEAKENYYSIGRLYGVSPKDIAAVNNLTMEAGLQIGQKIKIPSGGQRSTASVQSAPVQKAQPVNHVVAQGEGLYRISKMYGVTVSDIKSWNSLTDENVKIGQTLVINKAGAVQQNVAKNETAAPAKTFEPVVNTPAPVKKVIEDTALVYVSPAETKATESKKEENIEKAISIRGTSGVPKTEASAPVKESPANEAPKKETNKVELSSANTSAPAEGAFASIFPKSSASSASSRSGEASTFKTTSGWQDKKYYVLINDVAPGTIVKISAADKVVYAKVLGNMPEMKENNGLLLRLSNSAASHLGILDPKFPVQVTYYQ